MFQINILYQLVYRIHVTMRLLMRVAECIGQNDTNGIMYSASEGTAKVHVVNTLKYNGH